MKLPVWRIEDPDPAIPAPAHAPALVSLHYLRAALRRARRIWLGLALLGLLAGIGYSVLVPPPATGTVTLLLEHDPSEDGPTAMATDVSMLRTRAVADNVIDRLDLRMTPEAFQAGVETFPETSTILVITVAGTGEATAVERAGVLAREFLVFRSAQLRAHSNALIKGYERQVADRQREINRLTREYDDLAAEGPTGDGQAAELLTRRAQVFGEISRIRQVLEETTLTTESVIAATSVLDEARAVPSVGLKRTVLLGASGLILGLGLGVGLVLLMAMTTDRVRRREDVAEVLEMPVRLSTGPLRRRPWSWLIHGRTHPDRALDMVVQGLDNVVRPRQGRHSRFAIVSTGNVAEATRIVAALGHRLAGHGLRACLVDLSAAGRLERVFARTRAASSTQKLAVVPSVIRPDVVPALARGPRGLRAGQACALENDEEALTAWRTADVVLVLAEVDPGLGVANLPTWASRLVLLVTAGRSSVEQLRTTATLVQSANGINKEFVVLLGADRSDDSLGETVAADTAAEPRARSS